MRRQAAFTLIEVLVTLVVLGVGATAFISVFSSMVRGSADPVIQQQAITIAEAYMEEILRKPYQDPGGGETGAAEAGENRATFDDVQDYNSLPDNLVRDQNNAPVAALANYTVTVNVDNTAVLNGVAALQIDVSVSHAATGTIALSAFRTSYP